jgi:hypothetical protein
MGGRGRRGHRAIHKNFVAALRVLKKQQRELIPMWDNGESEPLE